MNRCTTVEDGVRAALAVYNQSAENWEYHPAENDDYCDHLTVDGVKYPLFWWRTDTQVRHLIDFAPGCRPCSMKLNRSCTKREGMDRLLYRELDIATACLGADVDKVMCFRKSNSLTMIATMKNERVAVFELAAVLNENTPEQGRHIYWGEDGMSSDRVVSQKMHSDAVYLFTEDDERAETYNDIFLYMYGLDKLSATKAAAIAEILLGRVDPSEWTERDTYYKACIGAANKSSQRGERIEVRV